MPQTLTLQKVDQEDPTPKYLQARTILVDAIRSGRLAPGAKLPSTKEISGLINISLITAHKALEGLVQAGWLRREVGRGTFVREDVDPGVMSQRTIHVGLLIESHVSIGDYYHGTIINALRRCAAEDDRKVEFFFHDRFDLRDKGNGSVGAICLHPTSEARPEVEHLAGQHPIVVLGGRFDHSDVTAVDCDNAAGAADAVNTLCDMGHKRFLLLGAPQNLSNARDRIEGATQALAERGIPVEPEDCVIARDSLALDDASAAALRARLIAPDRPTAVVAGGFYLALAAMHTIREVGLSIPDDISVVGFDDPVAAAMLNPPLTTVRQPLELMAETAYERVCKAIAERHNGSSEQVNLPAEFIQRESIGPAAN